MPTARKLTVPISYLGKADRDHVAAHLGAWAAEQAGHVLDEVVILGGAIEYLRTQVGSSPRPVDVLKTMAGTEGQLRAQLRIAREWASMAGAYLPVAVREALARFPKES